MPFNRREAERRLRLRDFASRAESHFGGAYVHADSGTRYLPRHAFADEADALARIGGKPADCFSVDAYWEFGDDVCFLQVWTQPGDPLGRTGLYARWPDGRLPYLYVVGIVPEPEITRATFEAVLTRFLAVRAAGDVELGPSLGDRLVRLDA